MFLKQFIARSHPAASKLFKTPIRGGMLILTNREIVLGEGWLGTKNVRQIPLQSLIRFDLLPAPGQSVLQRSMLLRLVCSNEQTIEVQGIGPAAAQRIRDLLQIVCRLTAHKE